MPPLPASEEVRQKYNEILRNNGIEDEVDTVEIDDPGLAGEHTASSCEIILITFVNKELSALNLFVKKFTKNPGYADLVKEMNLFAKEASFFNDFLPQAKQFCFDKTGSIELIDYFPKCYYGDEELIVLENLKAKGLIMLKKEEFQDFEEAKLVMKNLARLHAVSYAMIQKDGLQEFKERFPVVWSEAFVGESFEKLMSPMYDNSLRTVIAILKEHPTDGSQEAIEKFESFVGKAFDLTLGCIPYNPEEDKIIVLNHGDCWNNNMMFSRDASTGKVDQHIFLDLQVTRLGSPNLDISYFLYTSVKPVVRRNNFKTLMRFYFDEFEATVLAFNATLGFTFEDFLSDYKKKSTYGYFMGLTSNCAPEAMGEMDFETMDPDVEKLVEQMNQVIISWVKRNPDSAAKISCETVTTLNEYLN